MVEFDKLQRGDIVQVDWIDIHENVTGDPDQAVLSERQSFAMFWGMKEISGIPCMVTSTTRERDGSDHSQSGFCTYPTQCIVRVQVIRKARRKRVRVPRVRQSDPGS